MGILGRLTRRSAERRFIATYQRWMSRGLDMVQPGDPPVAPGTAAVLHRQGMAYARRQVLPREHYTVAQAQAADLFEHEMQQPCGLWYAQQLGWHPVLFFEALTAQMYDGMLRDVDREAADAERSRLKALDDLVRAGDLQEATQLARRWNAERL